MKTVYVCLFPAQLRKSVTIYKIDHQCYIMLCRFELKLRSGKSSVISYLTARPSWDVVTAARQAITLEWWEEHKTQYEIFLSELVLEEIGSGDSSAAQKGSYTSLKTFPYWKRLGTQSNSPGF
uniref:Uncharacterized protein n=1 Tax=Candidatus Kentrum sp. FW TaxID=2126338 RepID=A0A450SRB4_9GAMM|nr:MAG: hypothetical protein BECKFW1821A_GA0114235_102339 [Candidatus Kentron sp. FW]VFJ56573.1 MAG: hypothetical protein BECKFW1821B_GA0114236_102834 [Candidatus Kentron sp. FW]